MAVGVCECVCISDACLWHHIFRLNCVKKGKRMISVHLQNEHTLTPSLCVELPLNQYEINCELNTLRRRQLTPSLNLIPSPIIGEAVRFLAEEK